MQLSLWLSEVNLRGMGKCAQDDYYLMPMEEAQLPKEIRKRFTKRIEDIVPLDDYFLLVFSETEQ